VDLHPKHSQKPDPDQLGDLLKELERLMPCPGAAAMTRTPFSLHVVSGEMAKIGEDAIRGPDFLQPQFAALPAMYPRRAWVSQTWLARVREGRRPRAGTIAADRALWWADMLII
jgi:hypothetical protein